MNLLPGCLPPQSQESFSSWFARLAYNHWVTPQQLYQYLLPGYSLSFNNARWFDQAAPTIADSLVSYTLTSYERIQLTLLTNFPLYQQSVICHQPGAWLLHSVPRDRYSAKAAVMYCPRCLAKDEKKPYFRQRWQLSFLTACLPCQVTLLDQCPHCEAPPAYLHISLANRMTTPRLSTCWRCSFNLATAPAVNAAPGYLMEQRSLLHQLTRPQATDAGRLPSYFFVLHQVLKAILSLVRSGQLALPLTSVTSTQVWPLSWGFSRLPIWVRNELLHWALRLTATGAIHYQAHLAAHRQQKTGPAYRYPTTRLFVYFRDLLMNRSVEELVPLFGPHLLIDRSSVNL